jgi:hypothetical protein
MVDPDFAKAGRAVTVKVEAAAEAMSSRRFMARFLEKLWL